MRFKKEVYYKIFVPENITKCTKDEFIKENREIYEEIKNTTLQDFLPDGKKRAELGIMAPILKRIAINTGDNEFKCAVMTFLNKVQYDNDMLSKEINDILNELLINAGGIKDFSVLYKLNFLIEAKDEYTRIHSENVSKYAALIGEEIGLSDEQVNKLRIGGLLHDIGKIAVSDYILNKSSSLTDSEYDIMKKHPVIGESLFPNEGFEEIKQIIRSHHERVDGHGYPDGLVGDEIPLFARIISIVDSFDAMTTQRTYNKCKSVDEAINELYLSSRPEFTNQGVRQQFDSALVDAFIRIIRREQHNVLASELLLRKTNRKNNI